MSMMKKSPMSELTKLTDEEFLEQFRECKIDPAAFDHEAHLRLAWVHIRKYGLEKAKANIQAQLQKFVEYAGARDKYHTTLTVAAIEAVNHFMQKSSAQRFDEFIREHPKLKDDFKTLISSHYSFDIFSSEEARKGFVAPDVQPF